MLLDLLSSYDVVSHLHNKFVHWMGKLKVDINILEHFLPYRMLLMSW
jgi:hypothetical protein